jgi:hypothetical protein
VIDRGLVARARALYNARAPKGVAFSDVLAVIDKESAGIPYFLGNEPLFRMNLNMALSWVEPRPHPTIPHKTIMVRFKSGATEKEIRDVITIPAGALQGKWSKFRFEYGYWHEFAKPLLKVHEFTPAQLVLLSSSVGLGQQMLRFVVQKLHPELMLEAAYQFMGDLDAQISWVMGNLEHDAHQDKQLMFARYNAGPGARLHGKTYNTYGADVLTRSHKIELWLKEQKL